MITSRTPTLAQMENALARVVGARGVAAMRARSRQLCSDEATEDAALRRLSADLLGAALAQRLLQQPGTGRY
jgi:hypothetical protein